ncbi:MAG: hypothetical protein K2Q01_12400, partial [Rickettsiales bacterium]|nr:hypothetical protein [Rickettsiales bacterium]
MTRITRLLAAALIFLLPTHALAESSVRNEHTTISLIAEKDGIPTGEAESFRVGVRIEAHDGWHTYWENPGDAGLATQLKWTLPEGFTASSIDWPTPTRMNEGPLSIYAYEGEVFLPVTITPAEPLKEGEQLSLKLRVDLLVCHEICVPEGADLELSLPVLSGTAKPSEHAAIFKRQHEDRVIAAEKPGTFRKKENALLLTLPLASLSGGQTSTLAFDDIKTAQFFPREQNLFSYTAEQTLSGDKKSLTIAIPLTEDAQIPARVSGLLSLQTPKGMRTFNVEFKGKTPLAKVATPETLVFPVALLLALLGGLVLNLMPCVLPVLSLKALALAKKSSHGQKVVIRQGIAYTLGIAVSFALISGLLISLRAGGEAVGWGYQMQSPAFVASLIYLLFLVGLSLSGMFYLPVLLGGVGVGNEASAKGSFLTGV